jgi:signal transduction histidine kinase
MPDRFLKRLSIRERLALWYALSLAVAMAIVIGAIYVAMRQTLQRHLEADLRHHTATLAARLLHEFDEGEESTHACESLVRKSPILNLSIEVYGPEGARRAFSENLANEPLATSVDLGLAPDSVDEMVTATVPNADADPEGMEVTAIAVQNRMTNERFVLVAGSGRTPLASALDTLEGVSVTLVPLLVALASVGGWLLARRALAPVASMTRQARRVGAERLGERLVVENSRDELGELAVTFNEMLDRIQSAFDRMRQFVADASHELRTPIAVIRSGAAVALTKPVTLEECEEMLGTIQDQTVRLSGLVDDLFLLARADAGDPGLLRREPVLLDDLAASCVREAMPVAIANGSEVVFERSSRARAVCLGDRAQLERMLMNLILNGIRYAGNNARIEVCYAVRTVRHGVLARIDVIDDGPGIPEAHRDAIFERFVRLESSRSRETGGSGLGLPIARFVAQAHNGTITYAARPQGGSIFTVELPVETFNTLPEPSDRFIGEKGSAAHHPRS